jgi:hypothetical protein
VATPGCNTTTGTTGVWFTIISWVLQLATWALSAPFMAGFSGSVYMGAVCQVDTAFVAWGR